MQLYHIVHKIIFTALHLMLFVVLFYYLIENIIYLFFANLDRITLAVLNGCLNASNKTFEKSVIYKRILKYVDLPFEFLVYKNIF